jgi:hypothetical protein
VGHDLAVDKDQDFLRWGRAVIDGVADRLERAIPDAKRGTDTRRRDVEAVYVHFHDRKVPGRIAVWLYAAPAGSANSVRGYRDAIGIGLKQNADEELDPGAFRFRRLTPWRWQTHVDERYAGVRWLRNADELPAGPDAAADELAERLLRTLRTAEIVDQAA